MKCFLACLNLALNLALLQMTKVSEKNKRSCFFLRTWSLLTIQPSIMPFCVYIKAFLIVHVLCICINYYFKIVDSTLVTDKYKM